MCGIVICVWFARGRLTSWPPLPYELFLTLNKKNMKKIMIRRKEVLNHLPKEIRAGAKVSIGSIYVNRQPLKGVEGEEAAKLLSKILDVPPGHQDWPKKEKEFWASMAIKVPFEGVELDITLDEDGMPYNVTDYLTYKWCQRHRQVASNESEMKMILRKSSISTIQK